jgi:hypothetical protein
MACYTHAFPQGREAVCHDLGSRLLYFGAQEYHAMTSVTIHLPDDIAAQYQHDDLARCVLEAFAVQEYAQGRLTLLQLRHLLGLDSRSAAHGLLKKHGVSFYPYEAYQKDMATLDRTNL